jgi:hypothetical protein
MPNGDKSMIMRAFTVAAAAALIAAPALAGEKKSNDPSKRIVCIEMTAVGSHIPDRICQTQAEWEQEKTDAKSDIDHLAPKQNELTHGGIPGNGGVAGAPH